MNILIVPMILSLFSFCSENKYSYDSLHDKAVSMGYSDEKIKEFTSDKLNEIASYNIVNIQRQTMSSAIDEERNDLQDSRVQSDNSKTLNLTITTVKNDEFDYLFVAKSDVTWTSILKERLTDLLTIQYTQDLTLLTDHNQVPQIEMHYNYQYYHYEHHSGTATGPNIDKTEMIRNSYDGNNTSNCNINLQNSYVSFEIPLPSDYHHSFGRGGRRSVYKKEYSKFFMSLEAKFGNSLSSYKKSGIQAIYNHQMTEKEIQFEGVTFSTTYPYINLNFGLKAEKYFDGLSNYMTLSV